MDYFKEEKGDNKQPCFTHFAQEMHMWIDLYALHCMSVLFRVMLLIFSGTL